ncbi:hypothetical protein APS56_00825 [Pseudalgibacter alginicilyticus]|uniref:Uncharacterized protein n=1 Tax=Pseudalgibacter alginicilyticus TaxID=1736674 RepID=A0A0P0CM20_9FLAO|nr:hypothetical protein [Pseudalgibacter alginicilyticus]ALJ03780.1 hypothetical protein APS56_00825 [Pseudalgibacter alginicilyticus]
MDNPFKDINKPLKEVPQELKAKVMHDIAVAKLLMELAALFSYNIGDLIESVMKQRKNTNNHPNNKI